MIKCPLCQQLVWQDHPAHGIQSYVPDYDTRDFYCPTHVEVHPGDRLCHYIRTTSARYPEYRLIVPPFRIRWWSATKDLQLQKFNVDPNGWRHCETIQTWLGEKSFDDFVKLAQRTSNLKAFV